MPRIPITRYGLPQVVVYPALTLAAIAAAWILMPRGLASVLTTAVLALVHVWMVSFFRDPARSVPLDPDAMLSPADGTVTDVAEDDCPELGGRAVRIGIFLSVFNVHVNRAPCDARIEAVIYKKGRFKNAMAADSGRVNESNGVLMTPLGADGRDGGRGRILVRQISGAVARRIVCRAEPGAVLGQGDRFGMIKFGSRTELWLPLETPSAPGFSVAVKIGDRVRAGITPLVLYEPRG